MDTEGDYIGWQFDQDDHDECPRCGASITEPRCYRCGWDQELDGDE